MGLQARPLIPARQFQQSGADRRLYSLRHEIERQVPGCSGRESGNERKDPIEVQPDPVPFVAAVIEAGKKLAMGNLSNVECLLCDVLCTCQITTSPTEQTTK